MTAEERYWAQKLRDRESIKSMTAHLGLIDRKTYKTARQIKETEEHAKKTEAGEIAGYGSIRYDFPEYVWWMVYDDSKKYFRSSNSWRVYDYSQSNRVVGTWNDETKKIEFSA